jgi:uncharacterized protein (TIGR02001 family)
MKRLLIMMVGVLVAPRLSAEEWTPSVPPVVAQVSLATHYLSRGFDISDGPPSPQLGAEWLWLGGMYIDGYAAKIRYFGMNAEVDATLGYRSHHGALNYDLGLYYYDYPGADRNLHSNFAEFGSKISWGSGPVIPTLEAYVSPNYFFASGKGLFISGGVDFVLPYQITSSARIGYVTVENNRAFIYPDYMTWLVSIAKPIGGMAFSLQVTDTSITYAQCIQESRCSTKVTFKVSKSF